MIHNLFDAKVKLEPESHRYYDFMGREYMSVSKFLDLLVEPFESTDAYARASEEKRREWKEIGRVSADHGTRIHNALEMYSQTGMIRAEDMDLAEMVRGVIGEYGEYSRCYEEVCLYHDGYRLAGTADKICMISNRGTSDFDLSDFKTNSRKGIVYYSKYGKRCFEPIGHLQDCNYVRYSLQLSVYAYFMEQLTGRKVRQMWIHYIPSDNYMAHRRIPVMYMKNDVLLLLEFYKNVILSRLGGLEPAF